MFLMLPDQRTGTMKPGMVVLDTSFSSAPPSVPFNFTAAFSMRWMGTQLQEHPEMGAAGVWSWMDGSTSPVAAIINGTADALTVTPAFFAGGGWLAAAARGYNRGATFVQTMEQGLRVQPRVLMVCQWNEFAGQPGGPGDGSFVDSYNVTFTNDMEPISSSECGYARTGDAGQLPRCNTGYGFFPLNLLRASLAALRGVSHNTVLRLVAPMEAEVAVNLLQVTWAVIGDGADGPFHVLVDNKLVAEVPGPARSVAVDMVALGIHPGVHRVTVVAVNGWTMYALSAGHVDTPLPTPTAGASVSGEFVYKAMSSHLVTSAPVGFANLTTTPPYAYGPSIIQENGTFYNFYCSPGGGAADGSWDYVRMSTSVDGFAWTPPTVALKGSPADKWSQNSTCDPSIVKFRGSYFLYHTCINVLDPPDGYTNNRICVAVSDTIYGPFVQGLSPVVENKLCDKDWNKVYCVGQPSALVHLDAIYLYYSSIGATGDPTTGPNGGRILGAVSDDGVHFVPFADNATL